MDNLKRILFDTWNEWGVSSTLNRISRMGRERERESEVETIMEIHFISWDT